ncbi:MAG: hypothetical protein AB7E05_16005 [Sphingobium sp.]
MNDSSTRKALLFIEGCHDPAKLRQIATNAARQGNEIVEHAARLKLYASLPKEQPGTFEYDVWQSIYCLEDNLALERGKTIRLSRTRQKIARDGEHKAVADLIMGKQAAGFDMLIERNMPDLTFEAVAIRHGHLFDAQVIESARKRLDSAGAPSLS